MDFFMDLAVEIVVTAIVLVGSLTLQIAVHLRGRCRLTRITEARVIAEIRLRLITAQTRAAMRRAAREHYRRTRG